MVSSSATFINVISPPHTMQSIDLLQLVSDEHPGVKNSIAARQDSGLTTSWAGRWRSVWLSMVRNVRSAQTVGFLPVRAL
jgi:hypothetical protein